MPSVSALYTVGISVIHCVGSWARHMNMESIYEYGSRAGFWRLHRLFTRRQIPVTVYGVAMALARNPEAVAGMREAAWEIPATATAGLSTATWMKRPSANICRKLLPFTPASPTAVPPADTSGAAAATPANSWWKRAGFSTTRTAMPTPLPYWKHDYGRLHLIIPYTMDANDMRFATAQGFNSGEQFFYLCARHV